MSYCPSRDWDRYVDEQDRAAEEEVAFCKAHHDEIVACASVIAAAAWGDASERNGTANSLLADRIAEFASMVVYAVIQRESTQ